MKLAVLLMTAFSILSSSAAHAIPEAEVLQKFPNEIMPWFQSHVQSQNFRGVGQLSIRYYFQKTEGARCLLVLSPGKGEPSLRYAEMFYDLRDIQCDVFSIDHRGQGFSGRMVPNSQMNYVEHFEDYVDDFTFFVNEIAHPEQYERTLVLSHSMGGAIVSGYLTKFPKAFQRSIMSAPMIQINPGKYSEDEALLLGDLLVLFGQGKTYAPGQSGFDPDQKLSTALTTSGPRFEATQNLINSIPQIQMGGPSVRWVYECMHFDLKLVQTKDVFQVPTIIYQAENDSMVMPKAQDQICSLSPQNCQVIKIENSKHEILLEQDAIRDPVMAQIRKALKD